MQVIKSEDCGNSPKNIFLQDLTISLAGCDLDAIMSAVSDDVFWDIVKRKETRGRAALGEEIRAQQNAPVALLTIHHVVSHGKAGAVNGALEFEDGRTSEFCHVYEFTNAKGVQVSGITSYVI